MPTFRNKKLATEAAGPKPKVMPKKKGISAKAAAGVPLIASASGVKGGRGANRAFGALTGVTAAKSGVKVDPLGVAMALPVFKLGAVARALRAAGKTKLATQVGERLVAKSLGADAARLLAKNEGKVTPFIRENIVANARNIRNRSTVFPRQTGVPEKATLEMQSVANTIAERHYTDVAQRGLGHADAVELNRARVLRGLSSKRGVDLGVAKTYAKEAAAAAKVVRQTGLPEPGSIEMVKKTAAQFGQKVSGKEAKLISRLLRGRTSK
jgi:hypothetical protein